VRSTEAVFNNVSTLDNHGSLRSTTDYSASCDPSGGGFVQTSVCL
jgi:hypothetical protein